MANQSILKEISPECLLEGLMLKLKLQYFGHLVWRTDSFEKTLMLGKIEGGRRGWQDEMARWYHQLNEHEFGWTPGVGDGQGGLVCCSPWGSKESDITEWLKTELNWTVLTMYINYILHLSPPHFILWCHRLHIFVLCLH